MPDDELLTISQVAKIFKVRPKTVHTWVSDRRIAAIRTPGGRLRIKQSEVDRLLEARS
jgi:excisionase family DNA binding protein